MFVCCFFFSLKSMAANWLFTFRRKIHLLGPWISSIYAKSYAFAWMGSSFRPKLMIANLFWLAFLVRHLSDNRPSFHSVLVEEEQKKKQKKNTKFIRIHLLQLKLVVFMSDKWIIVTFRHVDGWRWKLVKLNSLVQLRRYAQRFQLMYSARTQL